MATTITMPQLGETVTEGTVAQWLKKPGDAIEKYEAFVEVSTDKVNAEVPAPVSGTLREIIVQEGQTVPTGAPIAIIDEVGAIPGAPPAPAASPAHGASPSEQVAHASGAAASDAAQRAESVRQGSDEPVPGFTTGMSAAAAVAAASSNGHARNGASRDNGYAANTQESLRGMSPAVRRLAREHDVDLANVRGTGRDGRVTAGDVLAAVSSMGPAAATAAAIVPPSEQAYPMPAPAPALQAPARPSAPAPVAPSGRSTYTNPIPGETIGLTQARRIIAQRMVESKHNAPHAWTMTEIDVTNVWKWRVREKDAFERDYAIKLTLLPFFIRAVVESLGKFPLMNAKFTDDGIYVHKDVNVAIAVALDGNLILPVIRHADQLSIKGIAFAAGELIDKARRNKLGADDLAGGTFTVNNTGANGSVLSAPILPPGTTGIVTMEAVIKRPVVRPEDDSIVVRSMMNSCLSIDHRVVDGSIASGFLADLKKRLEALGPAGSL